MKYIFLFFIFITACAGRTKTTANNVAKPTVDWSQYDRLTVVDMRSLDGCGFLLMKNDSTQFNPVNLPDSLLQNGKVIFVKYHLLTDKMTTCMSGTTIQIDDVKLKLK